MVAGSEDGRERERIAAFVCNYDGARHLRPCLDALLGQTRPPDEIVVVDNASSDGGVALVREEYPHVRVIEMGSNRGPCPARNRALAEAPGPLVLLIDVDAALAPDALEKLEAALRSRPDAALAQPRSVLADDPSRVHYDGAGLHFAGLFALRNFYRPLVQAEGSGVVDVGGAVSVALLCRRDALLAAGGFDEDFFILFEDLDLSMRLRSRGHAILSVEDALCHHRGGTAGISFRSGVDYPRRRAFLHSRNRWLHLVKNHSARTLLLTAPALLLYEAVWALFTAASGNAGGWLAGKVDFARKLPRALRQRSAERGARVLGDRDLLVGGPLTIAPHLQERPWARRTLRALSRVLAAWWRLVQRACG